ncbi:hypothetical protein E2C01_075703 [Portunus trituberculatus]|uniref:Uncharacterized protein n=1 Tax=Portunus trituberculatus TaxID=210409 RepID=A0A5B7IBC7_PORTR|nr:hypothetical protein [Portunus trituberculatus]
MGLQRFCYTAKDGDKEGAVGVRGVMSGCWRTVGRGMEDKDRLIGSHRPLGRLDLLVFLPTWYSGTMRALGSEGSPSARVRILPTVECRFGFLARGKGFLAGGL